MYAGASSDAHDLNAQPEGNYNIHVLLEALHRRGLTVERLASGYETSEAFQRDTAILVNVDNHWLALNRHAGVWFNNDSRSRRPRRMTEAAIRDHIANAAGRYAHFSLRALSQADMANHYAHGAGDMAQASIADVLAAVGSAALEATTHFGGSSSSDAGAMTDAETNFDRPHPDHEYMITASTSSVSAITTNQPKQPKSVNWGRTTTRRLHTGPEGEVHEHQRR